MTLTEITTKVPYRIGSVAGGHRAVPGDEEIVGGAVRPGDRGRLAKAARTAAIVAILAAAPMLAGCGESARAGGTDGQATDRKPSAERSSGGGPAFATEREARETATDAGVRVGEDRVRAGDVVVNAGKGEKDAASGVDAPKNSTGSTKEVVLQIKGSDEARFAGTCSVGGEKRRVDGRVPARYTFSPDGEKLECEIRGEGPGTLNVVLEAGGDVRSVQQSGAGESKVSLTYAEDRISVSQSSSGSTSQIQSSSVSDVSSGDTSAP